MGANAGRALLKRNFPECYRDNNLMTCEICTSGLCGYEFVLQVGVAEGDLSLMVFRVCVDVNSIAWVGLEVRNSLHCS